MNIEHGCSLYHLKLNRQPINHISTIFIDDWFKIKSISNITKFHNDFSNILSSDIGKFNLSIYSNIYLNGETQQLDKI